MSIDLESSLALSSSKPSEDIILYAADSFCAQIPRSKWEVVTSPVSPDFSFSFIAQSMALRAGSVNGGCSGLNIYMSDFPSSFTVSSRTLKSVTPVSLSNFAAKLVPSTNIPIKRASVPVFINFNFLASNSPMATDFMNLNDHLADFSGVVAFSGVGVVGLDETVAKIGEYRPIFLCLELDG